jgi:23S rRNA (cytidine1920-2'-O)/16S rRNA (cytidine1409-2'-O)-methyltransferase
MSKKERLDNYLVSKGYFDTKNKAQGNILAGKVKINGEILTKAGTPINTEKPLNIEIESMPYVSRGGFKLEKALKEFNIDLNGKICLDAGASTGGFTDCMLQNGAVKVYAVDVGYGQIAWKLRNDPRVVVIERTNIRNASVEEVYKEENTEFAEFCTMDLSFISIIKVLGNITNLMNPEKQEIIALIKPQFEAGKDQVPKSGVIKDKNIHVNVIKNIINFACTINLSPVNLVYSPIQGPAGNIEYLVYLKKPDSSQIFDQQEFEKSIIETVEKAHEYFNPNKINK